MAAGHGDDVFHHIRDFTHFELPFGKHIELPSIGGFQITKFMVLQVIALVLSFLIFRGLAKRVRNGEPARGPWWNFWETIAVYIRDEVVRPTIGDEHHHGDHAELEVGETPVLTYSEHVDRHDGHAESGHGAHSASEHAHPADRFLPFIWSCFFYVLFCNLLGAIPFLGSPTGHIAVTGMLALTTFAVVVVSGSMAQGVVGFWKNLCPSMGIQGPAGMVLTIVVWLIELMGLLIKHGVLAMRLFANIMAGHTVIAVILGFIAQAALAQSSWIFYVVTPASVLGQVGIGLLELFVAFLQAYIFAFLSALFISMAQHAH